jgi:hypothetical protein
VDGPRAWTAAGVAALGVLAAAAVLGDPPKTDNSVDSLLGADATRAASYRTFRRTFGADELTLVSLAGEPLPVLLEHVQRIHRLFEAHDELTLVVTASTAFPGAVAALSDPDLGGPDALPGARSALRGPLNSALGLLDLDVPRARLVAASEPGRPPTGLFEDLEVARAEAERAGLEVRVAGTAPLNAAIDRAGRRIESRALPGVVGLAALLLLALIRRIRVVVISLATIGLVIFGVDAIFAALGGTNNVLVVIHRPVALVLILASCVHLVESWRSQPGRPARAARVKGPAIRLALLTTATGFASLAVSPLPPIRNFGILSAVCLLVAVPIVLGALPRAFALARPPRSDADLPTARLAGGAARFGARHRRLVLALASVVVVGGGLAGVAVPVDTHAIHYFAPDSEIRRDHEAIEASGLGLQSLEVLLEFSEPWRPEPEPVEALDAFARDVVALEGVTTRFDPSLLLLEAGYRVAGRAVPPDPLTLDEVWTDDSPWKRATVARDGRLLRAAFLIETLDADRMDALETRIEALAARHLDLPADRVTVTGNYRLLLRAQRSLLQTLLWSLALTAVVMQVVLALALRSARLGFAVMLPNLVPVASIFIAMVALGIPLDVGTCMVASSSLAIAVDDTLHFCLAYRRQNLDRAAQRTGRAILVTSVVMSAGFAVLIPSEFRPTSAFGLLSVIGLGSAVLGDLVVLPGLLKALEVGRGAQQPRGA